MDISQDNTMSDWIKGAIEYYGRPIMLRDISTYCKSHKHVMNKRSLSVYLSQMVKNGQLGVLIYPSCYRFYCPIGWLSNGKLQPHYDFDPKLKIFKDATKDNTI